MKRLIAGTAAALLGAVFFLPCHAMAISAERAIVMDASTGRVLYEKEADVPSLIASTTKIMTALIICEQCNVLDRMQIPKEAVNIEGSSMYLKEGEILTIQDLLYGLMLHSGNDAAVALAIYCGGTVEGFVGLMNDKARNLGLKNTHFENPNGLDSPGHFSTARDLAVLTAYAMQNPIFAKTVSVKNISAGNRYLHNHNKLLWQVEGAEGVKTGFTKKAGRILVSSTSRDGRRLIAVTIRDPNDWQDHKELLEKGFSDFSHVPILEKGQVIGTVSVFGGTDNKVDLIAAEDFSYALMRDEIPDVVLSGPGFTYAPVVENESAGYAYICLGDSPIGKIPVLYSETIEQQRVPETSFWQRWFGDSKK